MKRINSKIFDNAKFSILTATGHDFACVQLIQKGFSLLGKHFFRVLEFESLICIHYVFDVIKRILFYI